MKLFISGDYTREGTLETLEDLDSDFGINSIVGSATSACMSYAIEWAEQEEIPVTLFFPEDLDETSVICTNTEIINKERPNVILVYSENSSVIEHLIYEGHLIDSIVMVKKV